MRVFSIQRFSVVALLVLMLISVAPVFAGPPSCDEDSTVVPGHCREDDRNHVQGHYYSVYAYDNAGDYYWDLGDGRIYKTVNSINDLDQSTLTTCDYIVNYGGGFGGDPFLNFGWIQNIISCNGYDDNSNYTWMIVHRSDPRFREDGVDVEWGPDWRAVVYVTSGQGNLARPQHHVGG